MKYHYELVALPEKTVVGISARTTNNSPDMGNVIGELWKRFYSDGIYESIPNRCGNNTFGIYTDYAGNEKQDYTAVVAAEVIGSTPNSIPDGSEIRMIPSGEYARFVINGDVKDAVCTFWQELWKMDLPRPRSFVCDFEEYSNTDMEHAEIHIYIGLQHPSSREEDIQSRCGIRCQTCSYRETNGCLGCLEPNAPFWGETCEVKACCENRKNQNCGQCSDFPCALLQRFSYDETQGDGGARIEQCQKWCKG